MFQISRDDFITGDFGENVSYVEKLSEISTFVADIEYWEEHPKKYDNDPYRIQLLGQGDWSFDNERVRQESLWKILPKLCETNVGGIFYCWEYNRNDGAIWSTGDSANVYEALLKIAGLCRIIVATSEDLAVNYGKLGIGEYIFVILNKDTIADFFVSRIKHYYSNGNNEYAYRFWTNLFELYTPKEEMTDEERMDNFKELDLYTSQISDEMVYCLTDYGKRKFSSREADKCKTI